MIEPVHRYDGYAVQSTGDGIFALFGAPLAHEDHPQRALYAALRTQEELPRYGGKLQAEGRAPVEIRVGEARCEIGGMSDGCVFDLRRTGCDRANHVHPCLPQTLIELRDLRTSSVHAQ